MESYETSHPAGWFENIPRSNPDEDPEFYAPDLIRLIESAEVDHEICTHTFTHVECGNVTRDTLKWELDRVYETHAEFGLERPISIVPPRHSPPPRDMLDKYGIEIIRSPRSRAPNSSEATNRFQLGKDILTGAQPVVPPRLVDGVVETYCTRYPSLTAPFLPAGQQGPHPVFRTVPQSIRRRLHLRNIDRTLTTVINRNSYLHLWSHLWEMANDSQWTLVEHILRSIATAQEEGQVGIQTMRSLNNRMRS